MDKAKWDTMESRRKDGLVLTTLWRAKNGKPIDIHWNDKVEGSCWPEYIPSGKPWRTHSIDAVSVPGFTTNRNTCVLVLDEIEMRGNDIVRRMLAALARDIGLLKCLAVETLWRGLRADPDTICYAAVKAVEEKAMKRMGAILEQE